MLSSVGSASHPRRMRQAITFTKSAPASAGRASTFLDRRAGGQNLDSVDTSADTAKWTPASPADYPADSCADSSVTSRRRKRLPSRWNGKCCARAACRCSRKVTSPGPFNRRKVSKNRSKRVMSGYRVSVVRRPFSTHCVKLCVTACALPCGLLCASRAPRAGFPAPLAWRIYARDGLAKFRAVGPGDSHRLNFEPVPPRVHLG